MSLIIIALIILIPQIGLTQTSDLAPEPHYIGVNVVPEIEVIATRLTQEPLDSIGQMPGVIVYAQRPSISESLLVHRAQKRMDFVGYLSLLFGKFALYGIVALFMITLSIMAVTRLNHIAHNHIHHGNKKSTLHKYYLRYKHDAEMRHYLKNLLDNSK